MIKNKSCIEISKGERVYQFYCDSDSPLGECYDALFAMRGEVLNSIQSAEKGMAPEEGNIDGDNN